MNDQLSYFMKRTEEDIKEIKADVKSLLGFKWQIIGGSVAVSVILSLALKFILN